MDSTPLALWPGQHASQLPTLTPVPHPEGGVRPMLLVLPGGGYGAHAAHEAEPVARAFHRFGLHAAVLRYRCTARNPHPRPIHDTTRAVRLLRERADHWGVLDGKVAILGFSAGGHLASTLCVHFDRFVSPEDDLAARHSARPDAAVLCYPVIDLAGHAAHTGSRNNLLGPDAPPELVQLLSTHQQLREDSPPTFLWHTMDDGGVAVANSLMYAAACREKKVRCELHVYESGPHGVGLAEKHPTLGTWVELAGRFLNRHLA